MSLIRAAAVQISPVLYSREGTVGKIIEKIAELAYQGVQFATFPETVVPYYPYFCYVQRPFEMAAQHLQLLEQAVCVPSATTHAISEACKHARMVVSVGVNERDGGSLFNTQLLFDADGTLLQHRRKISPTYHERMVWGQGDGSGLQAVDSAVGRIGQLACWEHYNPLARYALMADGEQIHAAMYPGSFGGDRFSEQTEINIRQHALESGCFVVNATAWLSADQQAQIMQDTGCPIGPISSGCFTAIVSPQGELMGEPLRSGEGVVIADLDFSLIDKRKRMMDSRGHYSRPELLSLLVDRTPAAYLHQRSVSPVTSIEAAKDLCAVAVGVTMTTPPPREIPFEGVRLRFDSRKRFDDVVAALLADVGQIPLMIDELPAKFEDWESYKVEVESHVGPSGFILFAVLNHGAWIKKVGIRKKVLRFVIGNPLLAITIMRHDLTAGLFAPVELIVIEDGEQQSSLTYVRPSSLMVVETNEPLLTAAKELDAKLHALAEKVTMG